MIKKTLALLAVAVLGTTTMNAQVAVSEGVTPNTWTFLMPAYDVEVETEFYPDVVINALPTAVTTTANGAPQALINTSTASATGGTFWYAVGTADAAPTELSAWSTSAPTATDVGTYYVWYKVLRDDDHCDCVSSVAAKLTTASSIGGIPVDVPASGLITYQSNLKVKVDEPAAALYTVTGVSGTTVSLQNITVSAADAPMLIYNTQSTDQTFHLVPISGADPAVTDVSIYAGFKGTNEAKTLNSDGSGPWNFADGTKYYGFDGTNFVLIKNAGAVAAHRCWIEMAATSGSARQLRIVWNDATGVSEELRVESEEFATAAWYDLQGRKVQGKPARKGVYIQNGQKKVIK